MYGQFHINFHNSERNGIKNFAYYKLQHLLKRALLRRELQKDISKRFLEGLSELKNY